MEPRTTLPGHATASARPPAIDQLTFLRFVAATAVLVFHHGRKVSWLSFGQPLWDVGNTAVSFFFFLSGFVLTYAYQGREQTSAASFYGARLARIVPVYWLALLSAMGLSLVRGELRWFDAILSALLLQAWVPGYSQVLNEPGWSLSVEWFFYLLFPWVLPIAKRLVAQRRLLLLFFGVWCGQVAVHVLLVDWLASVRGVAEGSTGQVGGDLLWANAIYYHPVFHFSTFVLGVLAGRLHGCWARHRLSSLQLGVVLVASSMCLGLAAFSRSPWLSYHHNGLFVPLFAFVVWGLSLSPDSRASRVLRSRPLVWLGEISYGVYILQGPTHWVFAAVHSRLGEPFSPEVYFCAYSASLFGVAAASFHWLEEPARRFLRTRLVSTSG